MPATPQTRTRAGVTALHCTPYALTCCPQPSDRAHRTSRTRGGRDRADPGSRGRVRGVPVHDTGQYVLTVFKAPAALEEDSLDGRDDALEALRREVLEDISPEDRLDPEM